MKDALGLTLGALLDIPFDSRSPMQREAIAAAREALAQPDYRAVKTYHEGKPVYVSQPEQEPVASYLPEMSIPNFSARVAWGAPDHIDLRNGWRPLYTTPPKRPWVELTDEETETLIHRFDGDPHTLLDEVNARLKEKNT